MLKKKLKNCKIRKKSENFETPYKNLKKYGSFSKFRTSTEKSVMLATLYPKLWFWRPRESLNLIPHKLWKFGHIWVCHCTSVNTNLEHPVHWIPKLSLPPKIIWIGPCRHSTFKGMGHISWAKPAKIIRPRLFPPGPKFNSCRTSAASWP